MSQNKFGGSDYLLRTIVPTPCQNLLNAHPCFCFCNQFNFISGFASKATNAFLSMKKLLQINNYNKQFSRVKTDEIFQFFFPSDYGFRGSCVNRSFPSLHKVQSRKNLLVTYCLQNDFLISTIFAKIGKVCIIIFP